MEAFLDSYPEAVLIGGWASWLRLGTLLSHDIDVILEPHILQRVRENMRVTESAHVTGRNYRAVADSGIKLDIYVPHQSVLGARLQVPVEELLGCVEVLSGRRVLTVEAHLLTKFAGLLDRPDSNPGEKDRGEIWGLLQLATDPAGFADLVGRTRSANPAGLIREGFRLLEDLPLTRVERQSLRAMAARSLEPLDRHIQTEPIGP